MTVKPARWNVNMAGVAPEWRWAWKELRQATIPGDRTVVSREGAQTSDLNSSAYVQLREPGMVVETQSTSTGGFASYHNVSSLVGGLSSCTIFVQARSWAGVAWSVIGLSVPYVDSASWVAPFKLLGLCKNSTTTAGYFEYSAGATNFGVGSDLLFYETDDGLWHTYAVTWEGTTVTFYKDGVQHGGAKSIAAGTVDSIGVREFSWGNRGIYYHSAEGFDGAISIGYVWGEALTADRIAALNGDPFGPIRPSVPYPSDITWAEATGLRAIPGADV